MRFPCSGLAFRLSLRCTSDTYSLHMQRMPIRKTDTQEQAKLDLGCLFDDLKHGLTKTYHLGLELNTVYCENRVQVQALV